MEMNTNFYYRALLLLFVSSMWEPLHLCGADPTDGFARVPLTEENFVLQKPYDVPLQDRYKNGLRRFWVYNNDKPFKPDSPTRPRTEVLITVSSFSLSTSIFVIFSQILVSLQFCW